MIPQERDLIDTVFSRLAQTAQAPKDPEALALINERMRALPDAAYGLVQAVLVQENMLKQAQSQLADLQRRLNEQQQPAASSFLNSGASNPWAQNTNSRPAPAQQQPFNPQQPPNQQPPNQQPQGQQQAQQATPWGQAAAPGGFLRTAATAAAGVAGGMLVAEGISSLFSGHHGGFGGGFGGGGGGFGNGQPEIVENTVVNNYYGDNGGKEVQSPDYGGGSISRLWVER
jgi:uncharacterized protein